MRLNCRSGPAARYRKERRRCEIVRAESWDKGESRRVQASDSGRSRSRRRGVECSKGVVAADTMAQETGGGRVAQR
jgi:hypothetical protein